MWLTAIELLNDEAKVSRMNSYDVDKNRTVVRGQGMEAYHVYTGAFIWPVEYEQYTWLVVCTSTKDYETLTDDGDAMTWKRFSHHWPFVHRWIPLTGL